MSVDLKDIKCSFPNREDMQNMVELEDKLISVSDKNKTIKIDIIDVYSSYNKNRNFIVDMLKKFYNIEISDQPDFLFYSCFGIEHLKYKDCVKIFFTGENVLPNFNECDYACGFDYIDFGGRYFHRPTIINKSICNRNNLTEVYFNRKFCNFIYSNTTSGEGALLRQEFCKKLTEYKHVDCPGKVLNNMSAEDLEPRNGNWMQSKREFLKKYKFTIAFENSSSNGYTTEKLLDPLQAFSIPIYWGNPLVTKDFNPKAFINCNDYDNDLDAVIERIKELDNDPDKYLAMLRENPMQPDFDFDQYKEFEKWLINIIEKGNKPFNKDPRGWGSVAKLSQELKQVKKETNNKIIINSSLPKESIEWSNTWIDKASETDRKRILIIGDSIARDFRGSIGEELKNYAIDFIGSSASLEDGALYRLCDMFFDNQPNKYSAILCNIGNQHGLYLHTSNNTDDKVRYINACRKFFEYIKKYCPKIVLLLATPNSLKDNPNLLDETRNTEICSRNALQKNIADEMNIQTIDLYSFVIEKKFAFRDIQHFTEKKAQIEIANLIISELKKKGVITND